MESGALVELRRLLSFKEFPEVQCHSAGTLRNLAAENQNLVGSGFWWLGKLQTTMSKSHHQMMLFLLKPTGFYLGAGGICLHLESCCLLWANLVDIRLSALTFVKLNVDTRPPPPPPPTHTHFTRMNSNVSKLSAT